MTLREFYNKIGSDYDSVVALMGGSERIVDKFVRKFPNDKSAPELFSSFEGKDYETAFRMAHTLKGVCLNLGFVRLRESSAALTEALRNNTVADNAPELLETVRRDYNEVMDALNELTAEG